MKTASVRDLRTNFPRVERWIAEGEEVQITKRRQVIARLVPPKRRSVAKRELPDFRERVRVVFGTRRLTPKQSAALRADLRGER